MKNISLTDSIAAVATSIGESGIGIVRISGKDALAIADRIFISKDGKKPSSFKTYTTHYGWIVSQLAGEPVSQLNRQTGKPANRQTEIIDEVILTVMRAPRSYTKEDIVEINCHGGIVALRKVLDLVLDNGCRLAEPGEFTKRAFLNGRIDLTQAEAVLDIIRAKTDSALKLGLEQLKGNLSERLGHIRKTLLDILSMLEAGIDFPDEEIEEADIKEITSKLKHIHAYTKEILQNSKLGRIFREGIHVVICGRTNVGKSSLLNALLEEERSIVTHLPGTTRDTIEEIIDIKGIPIRIVDTAGILEPHDLIEKKAVKRSERYINSADLAMLVFDGSQKINEEDHVLINKLKKKTVIAVINKIDLKQRIKRENILKIFKHLVDISAKKSKNIDKLEDAISGLIYDGSIIKSDSIMVGNLRHIRVIKEVEKLIAQAANSLDNKLSCEFIAQDLKDTLFYLDELLGKRFTEDLLDKIFSDFCIGK